MLWSTAGATLRQTKEEVMETMSREPAAHGWPTWRVVLGLTEMWASLAIAVVWLAVLFTAIYGPNIVTKSSGGSDSATIPSALGVALFAFLATWVIAKYAYGRSVERKR
jgi:hypothetical protein